MVSADGRRPVEDDLFKSNKSFKRERKRIPKQPRASGSVMDADTSISVEIRIFQIKKTKVGLVKIFVKKENKNKAREWRISAAVQLWNSEEVNKSRKVHFSTGKHILEFDQIYLDSEFICYMIMQAYTRTIFNVRLKACSQQTLFVLLVIAWNGVSETVGDGDKDDQPLPACRFVSPIPGTAVSTNMGSLVHSVDDEDFDYLSIAVHAYNVSPEDVTRFHDVRGLIW